MFLQPLYSHTHTHNHIYMQLQDKQDNILTTITHTTYMLVLFFDRQLSGLRPDTCTMIFHQWGKTGGVDCHLWIGNVRKLPRLNPSSPLHYSYGT